MTKFTPGRRSDGGRQRCSDCGHPRVEHREPENCSVPKCKCHGYAPWQPRVNTKDPSRIT